MPPGRILRQPRIGPRFQFKSRQGFETNPVITSVSPNSGLTSGGTAVTITGLRFRAAGDGSILVTFGGLFATSVVIVDSTTITCVTPAQTEDGLVDVGVSVGTESDILLDAFTYFTPTILALTPAFGPFSGETRVLIEGYNFPSDSIVVFGGTLATTTTWIDGQHISAVTPSHAEGFVDVSIVQSADHSVIYDTLANGYQYTLFHRGQDIRRMPGIQVHDILNSAPNSCSFRIDGNSAAPQVGEKIEIHDEMDNDRLLFAGTIISSKMIYEGQIDQLAYDVEAVDFTWLMNRRRPFGSYTNISASLVVKDLITKYAPGFTSVHVQTNLAKVTVILDGSKDLASVLAMIAAAIGGGHWYCDYNQDIHFFHIPPNTFGLTLPASQMGASIAHMTVAGGGTIPSTFAYLEGFYLFRHTFLYSDGTESSYQSISNCLYLDGHTILSFTGIPLGSNIGDVTCVGRRIYYNAFTTARDPTSTFENINGFCQINDNTTTAFTTYFGATGASVAAVIAFGAVYTFSTPLVATPQGMVLLSDQAAALNLTGAISNGTYGSVSQVTPPGDGSFTGLTAALNANWAAYVGQSIIFKFTATNPTGETTLGGSGISYTFVAGFGGNPVGPQIQCPGTQPAGASNLVCYGSLDGGANYHVVAAGLFASQRFSFSSLSPTFFLSGTGAPSINTASVTGRGWVGYNGVTQMSEGSLQQPILGGNIVYFATQDVSTVLENAVKAAQGKIPSLQFTGHVTGPSPAPNASINLVTGTNFFNGGAFQFKVANVYRDGSVSFPSDASGTVTQLLTNGVGVGSFNLTGIPIGVANSGLDVVFRVIYYSQGVLTDPNFSQTGTVAAGAIWPIGFKDPSWAVSESGGMWILPDNTSASLANYVLGKNGASGLVGQGTPYNSDLNSGPLSVDPIPIWPNPDGPSLEDDNPPDDIDDDNDDLLHEDSQSQPFTVSKDYSQIRNRVIVIGSGSVVTKTTAVGDTQIQFNEIAAFSPSGGQVKIEDVAKNTSVILKYTGVAGVPGTAFITLAVALTEIISQGSQGSNYFQADDVESQKNLAKTERDKDGNKTDGIHEYVIIDQSLKATFQLYMRAYAELELFSKPIDIIRYATRDPKSKSGQIVHVDLSFPPCRGDFLIQDVTIDQIHDESDQLFPRYTVTASSTKFELNDLLLQILGNQNVGNGGSSAGLVPTAVATAVSSVVVTPNVFLSISLSVSQDVSGGSLGALNTIPAVVIPGIAGKLLVPVFWAYHITKNANSFVGGAGNLLLRYTGIAVNAAGALPLALNSIVAGETGAIQAGASLGYSALSSSRLGLGLEVSLDTPISASGGNPTPTAVGVITIGYFVTG